MESTLIQTSLLEYFSEIKDFRSRHLCRHNLIDIIGIAILAVICGADEWTEIEEYGISNESFLKDYFELPNGIPSHDTFGRVFSMLNPAEFSECFILWVKSLCSVFGKDIINIDGKKIRNSYDTESGKGAIHMVSAWSTANNLVLGQLKVSEKSNEITAIPKLLDLVEVKDSIVTIDAMETQKEIAKKIREKEADYVLALKGNQGNLLKEVEQSFEQLGASKKAAIDVELDVGHGRVEQRKCYVVEAADWLSPKEHNKWKDLTTIVKIESYTYYKNGKKEGKESTDKRFYISSLDKDAERLNHTIRRHWGVETELHWILDVAFAEDKNRVRMGHGDENLSTLRRIALNKLKNETSVKKGVKCKRKKAGWDDEYLIKVLLT